MRLSLGPSSGLMSHFTLNFLKTRAASHISKLDRTRDTAPTLGMLPARYDFVADFAKLLGGNPVPEVLGVASELLTALP